MNRTVLLLIIAFFAINANAQTNDSIFSNNEYMVTRLSGYRPEINLIQNDDDTIWVSYADYFDYANCRIIALDNDLNITHNEVVNSTSSAANLVHYKINDKFYGIHDKNGLKDSLQFRCFDRNGNLLVDKTLWAISQVDTLWLDIPFAMTRLSDNSFFLMSNTKYPSNYSNHISDGVKFFIIDTLGEITKSNIYNLPTDNTIMNVCQVGNNIVTSKWLHGTFLAPTVHSTLGMSMINKETLMIEDSILTIPYSDYFVNSYYPDGYKEDACFGYHTIGQINDSILASKLICNGKPEIHIMNVNTTETISWFRYFVEGSDQVTWPFSDSVYAMDLASHTSKFGSFKFNNLDSIYTCYFVRSETDKTMYLELLNFNISGYMNFTYRFAFNGVLPDFRGMKITQDGSIIIAVGTILIKYHPNGLSSLTNIETGERESIRVYPNPAKDYIEVDIEAERFSSSEIELFDMQGRMVKRAKLAGKKGNRIDVSSLPPGAYTYSVSLNEKAFSGKIIIGN